MDPHRLRLLLLHPPSREPVHNPMVRRQRSSFLAPPLVRHNWKNSRRACGLFADFAPGQRVQESLLPAANHHGDTQQEAQVLR